MKKLILVRYGESQQEHLTDNGRRTMARTAKQLEQELNHQSTHIIAANIPRALESAQILADHFHCSTIEALQELYAAPEDGVFPDPRATYARITALGSHHDIIIAVVSREYIETLPAYIFNNVLNVQQSFKTSLNRGGCMIIDYQEKTVRIVE